jgi:hypothetical protein
VHGAAHARRVADECMGRLKQRNAPNAAGPANTFWVAAHKAVRRGMYLAAFAGHTLVGHHEAAVPNTAPPRFENPRRISVLRTPFYFSRESGESA